MVAHGDGEFVRVPVRRGEQHAHVLLTPAQLATVTADLPPDVALLACRAGELDGGFAQRFADERGGTVLASRDDLYLPVGPPAVDGRPSDPQLITRTTGTGRGGRSWMLFVGDGTDGGWDTLNDLTEQEVDRDVDFDGFRSTGDELRLGDDSEPGADELRLGGGVEEEETVLLFFDDDIDPESVRGATLAVAADGSFRIVVETKTFYESGGKYYRTEDDAIEDDDNDDSWQPRQVTLGMIERVSSVLRVHKHEVGRHDPAPVFRAFGRMAAAADRIPGEPGSGPTITLAELYASEDLVFSDLGQRTRVGPRPVGDFVGNHFHFTFGSVYPGLGSLIQFAEQNVRRDQSHGYYTRDHLRDGQVLGERAAARFIQSALSGGQLPAGTASARIDLRSVPPAVRRRARTIAGYLALGLRRDGREAAGHHRARQARQGADRAAHPPGGVPGRAAGHAAAGAVLPGRRRPGDPGHGRGDVPGPDSGPRAAVGRACGAPRRPGQHRHLEK